MATKLLSVKELSALLSIAEQTIYNRFSTGSDLPLAIKLGRALRFRESDVEAWIAAKVQAPPVPNIPKLVARRKGRPTKAESIANRQR